MTTANRVTYNQAKGGNSQGGNLFIVSTRQYSSKDLPGHNLIKERKKYQKDYDKVFSKNFEEKLKEKEKYYLEEGKNIPLAITLNKKPLNIKEKIERENRIYEKYKKKEISDSEDCDDLEFIQDISISKRKKKIKKKKNIVSKKNFKEKSDSEISSDEENDENDILLEYEKIKKLREEENKEVEKKNLENNINEIESNSLYSETTFNLKKKWFEDTVFQNQVPKDDDKNTKYINDVLRSKKHKDFLKDFILT